MTQALAAAGVVALWWLATGALLRLHHLPKPGRTATFVASSLAFLASLGVLAWAAPRSGAVAALVSFGAGFLAWAWQEVSFYTGFVTGPRRRACEEGCSGPRHFRHAVEACLHHEVAIVLSAVAIAAASAGGPNRVGLWTFVIAWAMHESARINVFLGVRNVSESFLPAHLGHLRSFLRVSTGGNALFPWSVAATAALSGWLTWLAVTGSDPVGLGLLAAMAWIGLAEHLLLMAPVDVERLWGSLGGEPRERPAPGSSGPAETEAPAVQAASAS